MTLLDAVDPRLKASLESELARREGEHLEALPRGVSIVLVGHRAAGKSRLLPMMAELTGLEPVDLDQHLERQAQKPIREWFTADAPGFRAAERNAFLALPRPRVVAVGGGFLSLHAELLKGVLPVLVPISLETYRERLQGDSQRPRLRPELSYTDELTAVFEEREAAHGLVKTMPLVEFLLRAKRGFRPRRVVTLPAGADVSHFSQAALKAGADLLEVRSDLINASSSLTSVPDELPVLAAERSVPLPQSWVERAALIDREHPTLSGVLVSHHSPTPLTVSAAVETWSELRADQHVKHVEPVSSVSQGLHLLETQRALVNQHGPRVTVLATGATALPIRALLSVNNEFEYVALTRETRSAEGQRLLSDVVREHRHAQPGRARLGLLGGYLAHSRSPRMHEQPFDRIELPVDADLRELLSALRPYYRGFAVTNPFKPRVAALINSKFDAVNTLVRTPDGWAGHNTDIAGAQWALAQFRSKHVTVLGAGGVAAALKIAAAHQGIELHFVKHADANQEFSGSVVWTWPSSIAAPEGLRFRDATVASIAYGANGRIIRQRIEACGGTALGLGLKWFLLQAREQRELWRSAS